MDDPAHEDGTVLDSFLSSATWVSRCEQLKSEVPELTDELWNTLDDDGNGPGPSWKEA